MNTESITKYLKQQRILLNIILFFVTGSVFYGLLLRVGLIFPLTEIPEFKM
jgi:hypothetical protein